MSLVAIVVAGGKGVRMGGGVRKQYLPLGGLPLMGYCLRTLDTSPEVDSLVLVAPEEDFSLIHGEVLPQLCLKKPILLAAGGLSRQDSVASGLARVASGAGYVLVHDAVRPFLEHSHIRETLDAAKIHGAATLALEVVDTLRRRLPCGGSEPLLREEVLTIQTPQVFRVELLREAHAVARRMGWEGTDDAGLVAAMGHRLAFVPGSRSNIKVTRPEDRVMAEVFLGMRRGDS